MDSLKSKTAKGLLWGLMNSGSTQLLNVVFGFFLASLLCPEDYGIVGLLNIFITIAGNIQDGGFYTALVNLRNPTHRDYNSVFWFSVSMSVGIYIILFFCAPLIAGFFHQPALVPLSRVVFFQFIFASLGIAHGAMLRRQLHVKQVTILGFFALVISGTVGVIMAFLGFRYWSLAVQTLLFVSIANIGRWFLTEWRPTFHGFSFAALGKMFRFGNSILITTLLNTFSNNILLFAFGRMFSTHTVGLYSQANKWSTTASGFVTNTVNQVAQPILASINDENERQKRVFQKMLRFTALIALPALFGLAMTSKEFLSFLGSKWNDCVPMLRMLCIGGAFLPFQFLAQQLVISKGDSRVYMYGTIAQIATQLLFILLTHSQGIMFMVDAFAVLMVFWAFVWLKIAGRYIGLTVWRALCDIAPYCTTSAVVMVGVYFATLSIANSLLLFFTRFTVAALAYYFILRLCRSVLLKECEAYFLSLLRHKRE